MSSSTPSDGIALRIADVTKRYEIFAKPIDRLRQIVWGSRRRFYEEVWALKGVTIDIPVGQTVGVVGANGSGKSTLLQIVAGTLTPTTGTVERMGRIGAILELGAGFNPDFSGRENAVLNATVMGMSDEQIEDCLPRIEEYADIGEFFHRPVKTYSSGMYARLAFSVAAHMDPDILIVDEALSVGDSRFQSKCFRTFERFQDEGKTILFVTHSVDLLQRHCSSAFLLHQGSMMCVGNPKDVVHEYLDLLFNRHPAVSSPERSDRSESSTAADNSEREITLSDRFESRPGYNPHEYRWGSGGALITDFALVPEGKPLDATILNADDLLEVHFRVCFSRDVSFPIYGLSLRTPDGVTVAGTNSRDWRSGQEFSSAGSGESASVVFRFRPKLGGGDYLISLGIAERTSDGDIVPLDRRYDSIAITVLGTGRSSGLADLGMEFEKHQ